MVDQLITVDSDRGPIEPEPVSVFYNGQAVDFATLTAPHLTARLVASQATTNAQLVKNSPGYAAMVEGYNSNAAARFLKFYNKATTPVVGTDIPIMTFYIEPVDSFQIDLKGFLFSTGIGWAITAAAPDNDSSAIASGDIMCMNFLYA